MKFGRMFNGISNTLFSRGCPHFLKRIVWKKYFWIHLGILLTFFVVCAYLADLKLLRLRLNIVSDTSCDTYQKKNSYRFLQQVLHRTIFGIWSEVQLKVLDFLSEIIWKKNIPLWIYTKFMMCLRAYWLSLNDHKDPPFWFHSFTYLLTVLHSYIMHLTKEFECQFEPAYSWLKLIATIFNLDLNQI